MRCQYFLLEVFPYKCFLCNEPILVRSNDSIMSQSKVSFFWDQSQEMSLISFPPKKQASDWLTYLVFQLETCFYSGKPLELMSWLRSEKKLTLVFKHDNIYLPKISTIIAANTVYVIHVSSTVNNIIPQGSTELALFTLDTSHNIACTISYPLMGPMGELNKLGWCYVLFMYSVFATLALQ